MAGEVTKPFDWQMWATLAAAARTVQPDPIHEVTVAGKTYRREGTTFVEVVPPQKPDPNAPCRCPMLVGGGIDHVPGCSRL